MSICAATLTANITFMYFHIHRELSSYPSYRGEYLYIIGTYSLQRKQVEQYLEQVNFQSLWIESLQWRNSRIIIFNALYSLYLICVFSQYEKAHIIYKK